MISIKLAPEGYFV